MKDQANIGLSEEMHMRLRDMHEGGFFNDMKDGYRLAASIAIQRVLDVSDRELVNRKNMYDVGGVDENFIFRNAISEIFPEQEGQEYRHLEKLADAGIGIIYDFYTGDSAATIETLIEHDT